MTQEEMFQEYDEIITKLLWSYPRHLWEDLRQEAFIKFPFVVKHYNPEEGKFFSLAFHCIRNKFSAFYRTHRIQHFLSLDEPLDPSQEITHGDMLEDNADLDLFTQIMLNDLKEKDYALSNFQQRRAKQLYYDEGYDERDVRRFMELPANRLQGENKEQFRRLIRIRIT